MSSAFHHGEKMHNGYLLLTKDFMKEHGLDTVKNGSDKVYAAGKIYAVDSAGMPDANATVYDLSLTKNATQMILALGLLLFLMLTVAKKYKNWTQIEGRNTFLKQCRVFSQLKIFPC